MMIARLNYIILCFCCLFVVCLFGFYGPSTTKVILGAKAIISYNTLKFQQNVKHKTRTKIKRMTIQKLNLKNHIFLKTLISRKKSKIKSILTVSNNNFILST